MAKGKFIVLEGGEGSGKGTCLEFLKENLSAKKNLFTREPGGTEISERIRDILLDPKNTMMSVETELLLFTAARAQHLHEKILPTLKKGMNVISDRFNLSTIAYQIYGRQRENYLPIFKKLEDIFIKQVKVDLYVFLDLDPAEGLRRVTGRGDGHSRFDAEKLAFHKRVRNGYLKALKKYPHQIIDASQPIEAVKTAVVKSVTAALKLA